MKTIPVRLGRRSYPIVTGAAFKDLGRAIKKTCGQGSRTPGRALIITHPSLRSMFGPVLSRSLIRAGIRPSFSTIAEGERSKNLKTVQNLYSSCLRERLDRSSVIVALGGGVVGDVAGFVAATYLRGVDLVIVPTTLLAMVDSSIGGKVGVDLAEAKNFVGSFYQPRLVWINPGALRSLPGREMRNGMAEVIKYGVIADRGLFGLLEKKISNLQGSRTKLISRVIARCARIKANVVSRDERETSGLREILNFGHTWGHAIEAYTGYRSYKHGEAIAIGMCAAGFMAEQLSLWKHSERIRMERLISRAGLPLRLRIAVPAGRILKILTRDKKNRAGDLRFVLPQRIGKVTVRKVPVKLALEGLRSVQPRRPR